MKRKDIEPADFPKELQVIAEKVKRNERLNYDDALVCFESNDVLSLGKLARIVKEDLHGKICFYNINRHINPTNVCVYTYDCKFCGFAALPGEPHAWEYSHEDIYRKAELQGGDKVREFHIVGGCHPSLRLSWYEELLRGLKKRFPEVHIKAFTAIEIGWFAKLEKISVKEVLLRLRAAGLDSLPGGGAEIFDREIRKEICNGKLNADEWLEVHRTAHKLGIKSNCTMLYGHIEKAEHRVDHLLRLRALQDETGGFQAFIPLAYHPDNNFMGIKFKTPGLEDLKVIAVSRLVLDNIPNIKAYWIMLTPEVAQLALHFGANDIDGTVVEETIYHMVGASSREWMTREELETLIRIAGCEPVERDTLYNPVA